LTGHARIFSLVALNTGALTAFAPKPDRSIRADAERLSHIVLEMQRRFLLRLCKDSRAGNVSFVHFFFSHSSIQKKSSPCQPMQRKLGHTTAAASGLVARLENLIT